MSNEATARQTVFYNHDGSFDRTREAEGPRITVKVVQDGEVAGKAVRKGQTLTLCERDAIRAKCWDGMVEIDVTKITRMGSIFLKSRCVAYYEEPVGTKGHIPKIKIVGTEDNALVGSRVLMKDEACDLPEDVVWGLLRCVAASRFKLAPGAEFTLPFDTLNAMVHDWDFDVYHHA
jgi:hypothetical protein